MSGGVRARTPEPIFNYRAMTPPCTIENCDDKLKELEELEKQAHTEKDRYEIELGKMRLRNIKLELTNADLEKQKNVLEKKQQHPPL